MSKIVQVIYHSYRKFSTGYLPLLPKIFFLAVASNILIGISRAVKLRIPRQWMCYFFQIVDLHTVE